MSSVFLGKLLSECCVMLCVKDLFFCFFMSKVLNDVIFVFVSWMIMLFIVMIYKFCVSMYFLVG